MSGKVFKDFDPKVHLDTNLPDDHMDAFRYLYMNGPFTDILKRKRNGIMRAIERLKKRGNNV